MTRQFSARSLLLTAAISALVLGVGPRIAAEGPLAVNTARITIAGTSNVHDWTAETTLAKVTRVQFAAETAGASFWEEVQKPGALTAFDISIPATSLKSDKEGLDKNMFKALKTREHPEITFKLARLEGTGALLKASGTLQIAGVEREITLPLKTTRKEAMLSVTGEVDVLMTDYGIAPPKAMMGMIKSDPKIKVTFELVLALATT
ncbi:MAG: YceI family protein [Vicinamibacterales bacterium]